MGWEGQGVAYEAREDEWNNQLMERGIGIVCVCYVCVWSEQV